MQYLFQSFFRYLYICLLLHDNVEILYVVKMSSIAKDNHVFI